MKKISRRFFKLFFLIGILSGIPFGLLSSLIISSRYNLSFPKSLLIGLTSGLSFGVLFGLAITCFPIIFERKKISLFAHPRFYYISSILSVIIGIAIILTKFHIYSYIVGVIVGAPFCYWMKIQLRKNIDNYAKFYTTPVEKRPFDKDLQKAHRKSMMFPLFGILIMVIIIAKIRGSILIAILGNMFWSFLWGAEYKIIYSKAKDIISKQHNMSVLK